MFRLHRALWGSVMRYARLRYAAIDHNRFVAEAALLMPMTTLYALRYELIIFGIVLFHPWDEDRAVQYWDSLWPEGEIGG